MNKGFVISLIVVLSLLSFLACTKKQNMTEQELILINSGTAETPFRVLLTTSEADSMFLRQKSIDVEDLGDIATDRDLQHFIKRLKRTMGVANGVGIAAPQVGIGRNIFAFMRIDKPEMPVEVAINPKIVAHSSNQYCFEGDGCLSVPEESGNTLRYEWIDVEYYNEQGELVKERLNGGTRETDFTGVIFQHENDHLNGVLFVDRIVDESPSEAEK